MQDLYKTCTTLILKAASKMLLSHNSESFDVRTPLTLLKNSFSLAGNANQTINQLRRDLCKPFLPTQHVKFSNSADDLSKKNCLGNLSQKKS